MRRMQREELVKGVKLALWGITCSEWTEVWVRGDGAYEFMRAGVVSGYGDDWERVEGCLGKASVALPKRNDHPDHGDKPIVFPRGMSTLEVMEGPRDLHMTTGAGYWGVKTVERSPTAPAQQFEAEDSWQRQKGFWDLQPPLTDTYRLLLRLREHTWCTSTSRGE
ncbi:unnamed protein product [Pleuronectes platessa]|uniref:Uncharacterized protein n=1 Tax=Pleuronectes platessa TaxID=8262 RepID=A0A9N7VJN3_PLEPL|nr:unnamed protein product [Pleuronectes platessa]